MRVVWYVRREKGRVYGGKVKEKKKGEEESTFDGEKGRSGG